MLNALTIDLEDYWSVFSRHWLNNDIEPTEAVVDNTEWFLDTLDHFKVRATFFVLGDIARKFPNLVKRIADIGHEIASHGMSHTKILDMDRAAFRREAAQSKNIIEDIIAQPVVGFRAPAFSITPKTSWALEVLAEEGYEFDSSIFPVAGKRYGWEDFSRHICVVQLPSSREITEIPLATVRWLGRDWPVCGGGYFRCFPYFLTKKALNSIQKERPIVVYLHPYEIDTEPYCAEVSHFDISQNQIASRHHTHQLYKRYSVKAKIARLLSDFTFTTLTNVIKSTAGGCYSLRS